MPIKVCVAGATGWAGSALTRRILESTEFQLVGAIARRSAGRDAGEALGLPAADVPIAGTLAEALRVPTDVLIDYAHAGKVDAPSGTTQELAEAMGQVATNKLGLPLERMHGPREARGASIGGCQVHSVRLPSYVIAFETLFGLPDERLTIRHDAGAGAEPYVAGTLLAARRVMEITGLVRGLDTLLFQA